MKKKIEKIKPWSRIFFRLLKNPKKVNISLDDFNFLSDRETIHFLKERNVGIVRYGNSELSYLAGYSIRHQEHDKRLEDKIINILTNYQEDNSKNNYLIAIPLDLIKGKNFIERGVTKKIWRGAPTYAPLPYLKKGHTYGSPFCFRQKVGLLDYNKNKYLQLMLSLFKDKNVIIVGPNKDEYKEIISPVKFIKIPPKNVFENYDDLMQKIIKDSKNINNSLVLITAGITASALSADLNDRGILTYDIGQMFRLFE